MDRARTAVAQTVKGVAAEVRQVPEDHPVRSGNERLDMIIRDVVDVVDKHLTGMQLHVI
jgi:hypothetical protein